MSRIKLSQWAKNNGVSYRTAWRMIRDGKFPQSYIKLETGTILVDEKINIYNNDNVFIYCRVSSSERKECLSTQEDRCLEFCRARGIVVNNIVKEIASGMNDNRKKLLAMLDNKPSMIVVENKDRLTRFGFNYLRKLLEQQGCTILVINETKAQEDELMKDLISIITSFCCRLYGLRRGINKSKKVKEIIND